jgi:hypothetical protein
LKAFFDGFIFLNISMFALFASPKVNSKFTKVNCSTRGTFKIHNEQLGVQFSFEDFEFFILINLRTKQF